MKKTMLFSAALLGAASFMMLTGFDSTETAESVLQKYAEASESNTSATAEASFDLDATLGIEDLGGSFDIGADGTLPMQFTIDPINISTVGNMNITVFGQQMSVNVEMYMASNDDGTVGMYYRVGTTEDEEPAEWQAETIEVGDTEELQQQLESMKIDYSALPVQFTLSPEAADVNGVECYELTSELTWDDLKNIFTWAMEQANTEEDLTEIAESLDQLDVVASGLKMNVALDISTDSYQAMRAHMDMDGSDWSMIAMLLPSLMEDFQNEDGTPMTITLDVANTNFDVVYDYDTPVSIVIPEEALAAAAE